MKGTPVTLLFIAHRYAGGKLVGATFYFAKPDGSVTSHKHTR